jgi:glycosyltransferase involved in cell wall biosynthesis
MQHLSSHRVVGLVGSMVPYHHARWQAFAVESQAQCSLLTLTDKDEFSVLEFASQDAAYAVEVLFPGRPARSIKPGAILSAIAAKLDEIQPSCVCLNGYASALALGALLWCQRRGVPTVMMSESTPWDETRVAWKEWLKSLAVSSCSAALVGGRSHAEYLVSLGLPADRISLGYDAVDNAHFASRAAIARKDEASVRKELGLPDRYFFACARFTPKKNLVRLLQGYHQYRQTALSSPWDLVLAGSGPGGEELTAMASSLGITDSVHFVGPKSYQELPAYYGLASGFIHVSTTEQWGLVVNEAMASGLPVLVSSRCGCADNLVQDGMNGYTFDPFFTNCIAEGMRTLVAREKDLAAWGKNSQAIVAGWSPSRFAGGMIQAVSQATRSRPTRAGLLSRAIIRGMVYR